MIATLSKTRVSPTPHATSCEMAGETVILDAASGQYFALNQMGTAIWQSLETPCTVGELCERLMREYDVSPERCEADVSALLDQLSVHGLVQLEP